MAGIIELRPHLAKMAAWQISGRASKFRQIWPFGLISAALIAKMAQPGPD
jgi:hypothetical protein